MSEEWALDDGDYQDIYADPDQVAEVYQNAQDDQDAREGWASDDCDYDG